MQVVSRHKLGVVSKVRPKTTADSIIVLDTAMRLAILLANCIYIYIFCFYFCA